MTSGGSPTLSPPIAYASNPISTVAWTLSVRRSEKVAPCTIPNCACPGLVTCTAPGSPRNCSNRVRARRAQRTDRSIASRAASGVAGRRDALVEHHRDVGSELRLHLGRRFGRQQMLRAIEMRAELGPLFPNLPDRREAEHLVAAAVGEDRMRPADERVQPAAPGDQIAAGAEEQVVGVAENDLGAEILEIAMGHRLHRAAGADRHERGGLDDAVRRAQLAAPRQAFAVGDGEEGHGMIVARPNPKLQAPNPSTPGPIPTRNPNLHPNDDCSSARDGVESRVAWESGVAWLA